VPAQPGLYRTSRPSEDDLEHATPLLKDFVVFLAAAGIIVPLFHRARIGAVLGFLLIGTLVGPHGFGRLAETYPWLYWVTISDGVLAKFLADLGVMFLLFLVGLELSVARLWTMRHTVLGAGGLQFALSAAAIGLLVSVAGVSAAGAIVLGLGLAMSSTAIALQLLDEQGRSGSATGRLAISILLFQDLMVAPVLFGTQALGREGTTIAGGLSSALLYAAFAVGVIVVAGYYLMRPLLRLAAHTGSREFLLAITLLIVIGAATVTGRAGLSTALGAFLAGLLLSETEYRHQIEIDLAPVKGLLLGLFFITVGMSVDLLAVWRQMHLILIAVAVLLLVKAIVLYGVTRLLGIARSIAGDVSLLLPQAGEFAFIVIGLASFTEVIASDVAQFATVVVGLSMLVTPVTAILGRRLGHRLQQQEFSEHTPSASGRAFADHVVIGGYGRFGQTLGRMLAAEGVDFVALDTNGELVADRRKTDKHIYLGDASRPELLKHLGASRARAFVVTVNAPKAAERMVAAARRINADAPVFARAADPSHAVRMLRLGAVGVTPEAVEASLQLGARLLESLGLPDEAVERCVELARADELSRLTAEVEGQK
jgi:CPA2 family monovalent cation:H+ antiporter-2